MAAQFRRSQLFFLLTLLISTSLRTDSGGGVDARPAALPDRERYVTALGTLGLMCRCCDGAGGECSGDWGPDCGKLDCHPWKFT